MSLLVGAALQGAQISGDPTGRVVLGIINELVSSASALRVNGTAAGSLARRAQELGESVALMLHDADLELSNDCRSCISTFERALRDALNKLQALERTGYLAQLVHRERNKNELAEVAQRIEDAFSRLMLQLRIQTSALAVGLVARMEALVVKHKHSIAHSGDGLEPKARIPPKPLIVFGRDAEISAVVTAISAAEAPGKVAILGGPGMGKTTVALAVLHHPDAAKRFGDRRFFVACDSAEGSDGCLTTLADAFAVPVTERKATQAKLRDAIGTERALLVLDNFESAWEARDQRELAEGVLRLLNDIPNLALIVTVRGAERPAGVSWSLPLMPPLVPLRREASLQTFLSVSDVSEDDTSLPALLRQLDDVPLAVVLMANLAQYETTDTLLARWNELETAMLIRSDGLSRLSSLDISIRISLESPRILAAPGALQLLALLSVLPHGVSDSDIKLWDTGDIAQSLSALLRCSLASRDRASQRIYVLAPIRSFMIMQYPPDEPRLSTLYAHYFGLAELASSLTGIVFAGDTRASALPELSNLESVIRYAIKRSPEHRRAAIKAVVQLCGLYNSAGIGPAPSLLPVALAVAREYNLEELEADLLLQWGRTSHNMSLPGDPKNLYTQALRIYERLENINGVIDSRILLVMFLAPAAAIDEAQRLLDMSSARKDYSRMARSAQRLGNALARDGRRREGIATLELAVRFAQQDPSTDSNVPNHLIGISKYHIAEQLRTICELPAAVRNYEEALAIFDSAHYAIGVTTILTQLADTYLGMGRVSAALENASRALSAAEFRSHVRCLAIVAQAHALAGDHDAASAAAVKLDDLRRAGSLSPQQEWDTLHTKGFLALARGELPEARAMLGAACALVRRSEVIHSRDVMLAMEAHSIEILGEVDLADERTDDAMVRAVCACVMFRRASQEIACITCLVETAEAAEDETAACLLDAIMVPLLRVGLQRALALALVRAATIAARRGHHDRSRSLARSALTHFGQVKDDRRIKIARLILEEDCES